MGTYFIALAIGVTTLQPVTAPPAREPDRPEPTLVTAATRADAEALAALVKPGEVLFREDFEASDALKNFFDGDAKKDGFVFLTRSAAFAHSGKSALTCTAVDKGGKSSSAGVNYWFGQPRRKDNAEVAPGYERVYFRYYIKWAEDYDPGFFDHTGGALAAIAGTNKWAGMGGDGKRPKGDDYCNTRFEASVDRRRHPSPGAMGSYATWMDTAPDKDGKHWGNMLWPEDGGRFLPEPGVWYCMEQMIQLNSFTDDQPQADGELATWINGTLYAHYTGIRWRSSPEVRLKRCGVGVYVSRSTKENTVWFDDLVVSTGYVGPLLESKAAPKPAGTAPTPAKPAMAPGAPAVPAPAASPSPDQPAAPAPGAK